MRHGRSFDLLERSSCLILLRDRVSKATQLTEQIGAARGVEVKQVTMKDGGRDVSPYR